MTKHNRSGVTLIEFLILNLVLLGAVTGFSYGITIGTSHGATGKAIGAIVGTVVGVAAVLLASFVVALICEPFDRFMRWWRPYPPVCENGTCAGYNGFETHELPQDSVEAAKGLSWLGWRCQCGNFYAGGYDFPFLNRWVRVLPNGRIRPYLRHGFLGRWQPDDGDGMPQEIIDSHQQQAES